jgi:hypothetical protein
MIPHTACALLTRSVSSSMISLQSHRTFLRQLVDRLYPYLCCKMLTGHSPCFAVTSPRDPKPTPRLHPVHRQHATRNWRSAFALPKFFHDFQIHPSSSPPGRTRSITRSLRTRHCASAKALASKVHPWISYLICLLLRPTLNLHRASSLPKQTSLVSKQNERLPPSASRAMQRAKLAGRHTLPVALQSSFGTLIRSKKSLGCTHTRFGMRGTCSTYTSKSCARRGSNSACICTASRTSTPSLRLPRRYKLPLEVSATSTGYPRFHTRSSPPSRHPLSVTPPPCNQFGV